MNFKLQNKKSIKKNNFLIRSTAKNNSKKKYFSSRSNTQDTPHNNRKINNALSEINKFLTDDLEF